MRLLWSPILFASFIASALGQTPLPGQPTAKARLDGAVVSSAGGPVPRAQVRLQGPPGIPASGQPAQARVYTLTTDDSGHFTFENVEPGRNYQLTATRPGYLQGRYGARSATGPGVPFALEAGQSTTGVVITMIPQGVISGRINDVNGDPIPGATVTMLRRGYLRGFRELTPVGANNANDLGEYRIASLPPGRYYMAVTDRRVPAAGGANSIITTYFPNGTDAQSAAPLDLAAGQDMRGVDIQMRMGRVFSVRGRAVDSTGEPLGAGIGLLFSPQVDIAASTILNPMTRLQVQTTGNGSFTIDSISSGLYTLQTSPTQAGPSRGLGRTDVTVNDGDVQGVELVVGPGQTVTGSVQFEGGEVKDLIPETALQGRGRLSVVLSDISPLPLNPTVMGSMQDDGTFTIENVARGKFQLSVAPLPPNTYVKSAKFSNMDIVHSAIDLTSGGGAGIDIVLARNPADVSGTILSLQNQLTAAMTVTLWSAEAEPGVPDDGVRVGLTDETGGFRFFGLRPGTYYIAAWEDVDLGLVQYRDFLKLLEPQATKLEVMEGEHKATQVRIISEEQSRAAEGRLP